MAPASEMADLKNSMARNKIPVSQSPRDNAAGKSK